MIPYARQSLDATDIDAVVEVLRSDFLTQGPVLPRFEEALAARCGAAQAVAVSSGTAALHLACLALGLKSGGRLWTSPNSFVASANCGLMCGASVDFVDVEPDTGNLDAGALARRLVRAKSDGALPDVVVPVAFAGQPCDMERIGALAREYGFRVLEDASHALGARYGNEPTGCGRHADVSVFSFHAIKGIACGEGGAALTGDAGLAARIRRLRSHGVVRESGELSERDEGAWYYEQQALGFNYRMTEMQAALGLSQLRRLDALLDRRRTLAARYDAALAGLPLRPLARRPGRESGWHLYVVQLDDAASRRGVYDRMAAAGVACNVHYIPIHRQPHYRALGFAAGQFPAAEDHYARALTLPLFPTLPEADQDRVVEALRTALGAA